MDFVREARVPMPPMAFGPVAVDAPPPIPASAAMNPLARLLPVAMLVAGLGMLAVYLTSGSAMRHPMYMFFPVMMLTSVIGTFIYGARGSNRTADINKDRRKYLRYIDALDAETATAADAQRRSSLWCHPEPRMLWTLVGGRRMWERLPDDPDFCLVRVGTGGQPLSTVLAAPDLSSAEELDPVTVSAMKRLIRSRSTVTDSPITLALGSYSAVAVDGDECAARALVRAVVCQLAVLHGPDHMTMPHRAASRTHAAFACRSAPKP
jgi:S-DNA-T family DNA segregation ATPase FtsK/SpoIIIE